MDIKHFIAATALKVVVMAMIVFMTDRDITTDHGWKIALSRGLDVFQRFELNDAFNFANRLQQHRQCKEFNVTYVRMSPGDSKS